MNTYATVLCFRRGDEIFDLDHDGAEGMINVSSFVVDFEYTISQTQLPFVESNISSQAVPASIYSVLQQVSIVNKLLE
jgi:hypothetical protein